MGFFKNVTTMLQTAAQTAAQTLARFRTPEEEFIHLVKVTGNALSQRSSLFSTLAEDNRLADQIKRMTELLQENAIPPNAKALDQVLILLILTRNTPPQHTRPSAAGAEMAKNVSSFIRSIWLRVSSDPRHAGAFLHPQASEYQQSDILPSLVDIFLRRDAIGACAREILLWGVSRKDTGMHHYLVTQTSFVEALAGGISSLFSSLPRPFTPHTDTQALQVLVHFASSMTLAASKFSAAEKAASPRKSPRRGEEGEGEGELDEAGFVDCVVQMIVDRFIAPVLVPALLDASEGECRAACECMRDMMRAMAQPAQQPMLLEVFGSVVLSDRYKGVRNRLVANIHSPSHELALATAQLIAQAVRAVPSSLVLNALLTPVENHIPIEESDDAASTVDENDERTNISADLAALHAKFDGIRFSSLTAGGYETETLHAVLRLCSVENVNADALRAITAPESATFTMSALLNALIARLKGFANVSTEEQCALAELFASILMHVCAVRVSHTASFHHKRASEFVLKAIYGDVVPLANQSEFVLPQAFVSVIDMASRVWQDVFARVQQLPSWEHRMEAVRANIRPNHGGDPHGGVEVEQANVQRLLMTLCVLEEWVLELRGYLTAMISLANEPELLEELSDAFSLVNSPTRTPGVRAPQVASEVESVDDGDDAVLSADMYNEDFISEAELNVEFQNFLSAFDNITGRSTS